MTRTKFAAALLLVAGLALSGCGQGVIAARVGGVPIPLSQVDLFTRVQCEAMASQADIPGSTVLPVSQVRAQALNALIGGEVNRQIAASTDAPYDVDTFRMYIDQLDDSLGVIPNEADRAEFKTLLTEFYRGQFQVRGVVLKTLADQGITNPTDQEVSATETALLQKFQNDADIWIDSSFGPSNGVAGAVDPSLSIPVSDFAKESVAEQANPSWVMSLPVAQRCG